MPKEVQHVPSGLSLCLSSEAVLTSKEDIFVQGIGEGRFPGVQGIEKAQNLDSYIITSVPRIEWW